jgi:hypothetical protein
MLMFPPTPTPSVTPVPGGTALTDNLTGWGTIALAFLTFVAVLVTLRTAKIDRQRDDDQRRQDRLRDDELRAKDRAETERRIQEERDHRQAAQARLVLITPPSTTRTVRDNLNRHEVRFIFANHGRAPVMGIEAEVWIGAPPLNQPAAVATTTDKPVDDVVLSGDRRTLQVFIESREPELNLCAWRIRWRDSDGVEWCIDQPGQREPSRFKGQLPRPC